MKIIGQVRHRGFFIALAIAALVGVVALPLSREVALLAAVNVFFVAYLVQVMTAATRKLTAAFLRQHADEEDAPALAIFLVMAGACVVSAGSLFFALMGRSAAAPLTLGLSIASVVLGWFALHALWAMHYAYEYYQSPETGSKPRKGQVSGGLAFPGTEAPDGIAFLYFAYVIGMTAQTSDTGVTSNAMRGIVTVHGIFSFFFNTVIVAAAVNIVVTLAH